MKKIDIKKLKKLRLSKKSIVSVFHLASDHRRLLFMIFWGVILIYSFDILYKKVYIEIQFIDYDYIESPGVSKETATLNRISEDIDARREIRQGIKNNIYRDPFKYSGDVVLKSALKTDISGSNSVSEDMQNVVPGQW